MFLFKNKFYFVFRKVYTWYIIIISVRQVEDQNQILKYSTRLPGYNLVHFSSVLFEK